jgi:hypothetical protein
VSNTWFSFRPADAEFRCKFEDGCTACLPTDGTRTLARNGHACQIKQQPATALAGHSRSALLASAGASEPQGVRGTEAPSVTLAPFEFAVVAFDVCCPSDVDRETDLLARAEAAVLRGRALKSCSTEGPQAVEITTPFYDEHVVWDAYDQLPGGVVLPRDRGGASMADAG